MPAMAQGMNVNINSTRNRSWPGEWEASGVMGVSVASGIVTCILLCLYELMSMLVNVLSIYTIKRNYFNFYCRDILLVASTNALESAVICKAPDDKV